MKRISMLFIIVCLSTYSFAASFTLNNSPVKKYKIKRQMLHAKKVDDSVSLEEENSCDQCLMSGDSRSLAQKSYYNLLITMSTEELLAIVIPNKTHNLGVLNALNEPHINEERSRKNKIIIGSILARRGVLDF